MDSASARIILQTSHLIYFRSLLSESDEESEDDEDPDEPDDDPLESLSESLSELLPDPLVNNSK